VNGSRNNHGPTSCSEPSEQYIQHTIKRSFFRNDFLVNFSTILYYSNKSTLLQPHLKYLIMHRKTSDLKKEN
jgi:hypothetical protein